MPCLQRPRVVRPCRTCASVATTCSTPGRLEELLTAAGLSRAQTLTASCHRSERSCLAWSVLHEVLGHPDVRVYDGGWQEYGHLVGAQVCRADPGDGPPG